ncbi:serine/threonine protein kinase [Desertifilum sp. FACHB-1129]|uniref:non-specific serine/threonine protein kinase n=1 Tax=Desertifilum tharense IPPAS B-1220 TaxID=1781255 RepID=A0A1E5QKF9_9CYAN|nr:MULTISPECIES: serine/threonine-protein kinase [Desertifilum]MDA0211806.1 serine/threonine-protein kinase [Cyanobacteria bacterium FC1]MBD2312035.1 serine/threonine protein kinase [Desertifilum sp. FACHB-1129]MBD2322488.1 serine/threonine protein kinase [Desertifilum sp. FACHB-866]MBD2332651.1 serine/threonine protein kinase [Desertifilum sp. FACHB-868]OEJ75067.1 serine/threonine protein kinase [Desertifilum tharense IPPAS B-1220]
MHKNHASGGQLLNFNREVQHPSQLGQLCGSDRLFRDRYAIHRLLGRGGFGVTFLAQDITQPESPYCVIKQLFPKASDEAALKRARKCFAREAKTLHQLGNHSQIPALFDYFEAEGEFYLVQEYVEGMTLTKEIRRYGTFSETKVKLFLSEILPLLQFIHYQGVIHRDIKPPNILRRQSDRKLVLIDFGAVKEKLAETTAALDQQTTTTSTNFVGTLGFAPPEQLSLRPVYGSDLYALGITCIYLLTGRTPLQLQTNPETGEICWRNFIQVGDYLAEIIDKLIKPSTRERYRSAKEALHTLDLEGHIDSLANCMMTKPLSGKESRPPVEEPGQYLPPAVRTAIAIRNRLARMKQNRPSW